MQLKELRNKKGYTQEELGKVLEVGRTTITLWELGMRKPSVPKMQKLAQVFNEPLELITDMFYPTTS